MFGKIKRICRNTIRLDEDKILRKVYSNTGLQQDILELNRQQLYDKGEDKSGKSLGEYAPNTIFGTSSYPGKIQKGQRYDHVTLKDTGAFYESFKFRLTGSQFTIQADDQKENTSLTKEFGPDIIGLSEESIGILRSWLRPLVVREVRKQMFE